MFIYRKLSANEVALTVCFTALYVVFGFLKISPIIGLPGQAITAAAIIAPIIGIILGPYIGTLSTFFGGIVGFFFGSFSPLSFISGIFAALCAGMLFMGKQSLCALLYLSLLLIFGFYPFLGAVWLYPPLMWFEIAGFLILASPLQSLASKNLNSNNNSRLPFAFFVTSLTSTLAGQIAGSIAFTLLIADANTLKVTWQATIFLYPVERIIIALIASLIGASLQKTLKSTNMLPNVVQNRK
jgi:predicted membrane protein